MSKIAFLYPGQGAQIAGMGQTFYEHDQAARQLFDRASAWLNLDMPALCFEKNDRLDRTEYTQAAMVTTSLAMTAAIAGQGLKADVSAGLSLGEYCAIVTAGGLDAEAAIRIVRERGRLMQNEVPAGRGAMAAILGLDGPAVATVIDPLDGVTVANYNCPGQVVITGLTAAVTNAADLLKQAGARVRILNVSGPFHSPLMTGAGEKLAAVLSSVPVKPLSIPYVSNVTGDYVTDERQIKPLLATQVASPVRWQQSVEAMIKNGVTIMIEIGPGKTLTGFIKRIDPHIRLFNIAAWDDMARTVEKLSAEE